jgi:acetolactate synthase-1/2/3 large subunit
MSEEIKMKVSDIIIQSLINHLVTHVFVVPGGFSMHLNDSLNFSKITPIYFLHESGAAFAASGYANYSGQLGVCLVTSGPGSTNALTAVASAWQDSLPLLVISGDAKLDNIKKRELHQLRQAGAQDVDIGKIVSPMVKKFYRILDPKNTAMVMEAAIKMATTHRKGSVWVSVPLDIQAENV